MVDVLSERVSVHCVVAHIVIFIIVGSGGFAPFTIVSFGGFDTHLTVFIHFAFVLPGILALKTVDCHTSLFYTGHNR